MDSETYLALFWPCVVVLAAYVRRRNRKTTSATNESALAQTSDGLVKIRSITDNGSNDLTISPAGPDWDVDADGLLKQPLPEGREWYLVRVVMEHSITGKPGQRPCAVHLSEETHAVDRIGVVPGFGGWRSGTYPVSLAFILHNERTDQEETLRVSANLVIDSSVGD